MIKDMSTLTSGLVVNRSAKKLGMLWVGIWVVTESRLATGVIDCVGEWRPALDKASSKKEAS